MIRRLRPGVVGVAAILMLAAGLADAQVDLRDDFVLPSARSSALGGFHATDTEDITVLYSNPAGLAGTQSQFSFSKIGVRLSGPVFTLSSLIVEGVNRGLEDLLASDAFSGLLTSLYAAGDVAGPLYFGYVGAGLGFGVFNATSFEARSIGSTAVRASVGERLILQGGYAFGVPLPNSWNSELNFGVVLKGLIKGEAELELSVLDLAGGGDLFGGDLTDSLPLAITSGIGVDIGLRYSLADRFSVGLVGRDAFSPTVRTSYASVNAFLQNEGSTAVAYDYIPFDLTAGVQWRPRLGRLERVISDFRLLLDYRDIFDFLIQAGATPNPLLKIGFGTELTILEILSVRGGFSEGLFAAGLGLDLTVMELDFAMFGSELSLEPGLRPVFNVAFGVSFGL